MESPLVWQCAQEPEQVHGSLCLWTTVLVVTEVVVVVVTVYP